MLNILYQDSDIVVVDKPSGMLVHPTELSTERVNCMHLLRDQIGQWVYPVHRLDRATSGALLFALSSEVAKQLCAQFENKSVEKTYYAIVRGYLPDSGVIDRPLREDKEKEYVEAYSEFRCIARVELDEKVSQHPTTRYSLGEIKIGTGRLHQIRKHLASIFHPVIGDTTYGEGKHNRFFRDRLKVQRLLLHARHLSFAHPVSKQEIRVISAWPAEFQTLFETLSWNWFHKID